MCKSPLTTHQKTVSLDKESVSQYIGKTIYFRMKFGRTTSWVKGTLDRVSKNGNTIYNKKPGEYGNKGLV